MTERKVVYNNRFGGFGLSEKALKRGRELSRNPEWGGTCGYDINCRHDETLVKVVEELGKEANGPYANLQIAHVNGPYRIDEYDGNESVETPTSYEWS